MYEQEPIVSDVVFLGATRPPMIMGVTSEAFLLNSLLSAVLFTATGNIFMLFTGVPLHILAYLICIKEPRQFELLYIKFFKFAGHQNKGFWKSNSYSCF